MIAVVAGAGALPVEACKNLLLSEKSFFVVSFFPKDNFEQLVNITQKKITIVTSSYCKVSEILKSVKILGAKQVLLIGKFDKRELLKKVKLDWLGIKVFASLLYRGDACIMEGIVKILTEHGLNVLNQDDILGKLKIPPGVIAGKLTPDLNDDIRLGIETSLALSKNDIGQTVVVKTAMIIAVEAIEGTDRCIKRGIELGERGVVVCKAAHFAQNKKFDLPTLGPLSLKNLKKGDVRVIAWLSSHTLIAQKELFIRKAEDLGVILVSVDSKDFLNL